jgi:hypothetical protein
MSNNDLANKVKITESSDTTSSNAIARKQFVLFTNIASNTSAALMNKKKWIGSNSSSASSVIEKARYAATNQTSIHSSPISYEGVVDVNLIHRAKQRARSGGYVPPPKTSAVTLQNPNLAITVLSSFYFGHTVDITTLLDITTSSPGTLVFQSTNSKIASIQGTQITGINAGQVSIVVTQLNTIGYFSETVVVGITVDKVSPKITFLIKDMTVGTDISGTIPGSLSNVSFSSTSDAPFTITTNNSDIANISYHPFTNTYNISAIYTGKVSFYLRQESRGNYLEGNADASFNVLDVTNISKVVSDITYNMAYDPIDNKLYYTTLRNSLHYVDLFASTKNTVFITGVIGNVYGIAIDSNQNIYFTTNANHIYKKDIDGQLTDICSNNIYDYSILAIHNESHLLVGYGIGVPTGNGINKFSTLGSNQYISGFSTLFTPKGISVDSYGNIWIGNFQGENNLAQYSYSGQLLLTYSTNSYLYSQLTEFLFNYVYPYSNGNIIVVSTTGNGSINTQNIIEITPGTDSNYGLSSTNDNAKVIEIIGKSTTGTGTTIVDEILPIFVSNTDKGYFDAITIFQFLLVGNDAYLSNNGDSNGIYKVSNITALL